MLVSRAGMGLPLSPGPKGGTDLGKDAALHCGHAGFSSWCSQDGSPGGSWMRRSGLRKGSKPDIEARLLAVSLVMVPKATEQMGSPRRVEWEAEEGQHHPIPKFHLACTVF